MAFIELIKASGVVTALARHILLFVLEIFVPFGSDSFWLTPHPSFDKKIINDLRIISEYSVTKQYIGHVF